MTPDNYEVRFKKGDENWRKVSWIDWKQKKVLFEKNLEDTHITYYEDWKNVEFRKEI